jgi:hypothetical protein
MALSENFESEQRALGTISLRPLLSKSSLVKDTLK